MKTAAWVLIGAAAGLYICGSLVDVDLWWHIVVGRWILHHHSLPTVDLWNYYSSGEPWRAYSWSNEVVYAWADAAYGTTGLLTCKAALAVVLSLVLCLCFSKVAQDYIVGALLGVVATAACYAHFVLRPQTLTWVLFALAILIGENIYRNGPKAKSLAAIFAVFVVWANTHLSAIVGICFLLVWVGRYRERPFRIKPILLVLAAAFAGTLVTPYFGGEWLTLAGKVSHPLTHRNIVEFRAATFADFSAAFLILLLILLLRLVHERPAALELPVLAAGSMLAYGGLAVMKFLPFGYIVLAAMIARYWREESETIASADLPGLGDALLKLRVLLARLPTAVFALLALLVIAQKLLELNEERVRPGAFPEAAVSFLQNHDLGEKVSNVFGDGGYLIYSFSNSEGSPKHKVVVDGRTNVNSPDVVEAYQEALYGRADWSKYLEFGNDVVLWRSKWPLASILEEHPDWCRVYFDGGVSSGWSVFLHVRRVQSLKDIEPRFCRISTDGAA